MCGCASFLLTSHNALFCISLTHTHTHTYAHTNCLYVSIHPSLTLSSHPALCRVAPTQNGVAAHISTPEPLGSRLEAAEAALEEVREKIAALQAVEVKLAREAATLAAEQSEEQPRESSGMAVPSMIRTETVDDDALAVHDMVMAQRRERELYGRSNDDNDDDDDDDDGDDDDEDTLVQLALEQLDESSAVDAQERALQPLIHTLFLRACDGSMRSMDASDEEHVVRLYASHVFGVGGPDRSGNNHNKWWPMAVALDACRVSIGNARRAVRR